MIDSALDARMRLVENALCVANTMSALTEMVKEISPFARAYKMLHDVELTELRKAQLAGTTLPQISLILDTNSGNDSRSYNAPVSNEVAFVFKNDSGEPPADRDLRAYKVNLTIPVRGSPDSAFEIKNIDALMNVCEPIIVYIYNVFTTLKPHLYKK